LGAVAGEIAYAIVLILAGACSLQACLSFVLAQQFPHGARLWALCPISLVGLLLKLTGRYDLRAGMKLDPGTQGEFVERSQE
jgi:hypothetical protein